MFTNQEYEAAYLLVRKIIRFVESVDNDSDYNTKLYKYIESLGADFDKNTLKDYVQLFIEEDILNCHILLGYNRIYKRELYILLDMVQYTFHFGDIPWSYDEFLSLSEDKGDLFNNLFLSFLDQIDSARFPLLYIYLSKVDDQKAEMYVSILQEIVGLLSKNKNGRSNKKDPRIDVLITNPEHLVITHNDNKENDNIEKCNQVEDDSCNLYIDKKTYDNNIYYNRQNMELLKDKSFNGISFEIIREEYREGFSSPFWLFLRVKNLTDHKKKIDINMNYISKKNGLKKSWKQELIPDNSFVDLEFLYEDITAVYEGDRIEMEINNGKFASLRLIRERDNWMIVESIERSTYNRELKNRIEHFEAIDEQFGITLQNFSVKVEDENSLNLFCEVLALNGEVPQEGFNVEVAIYDSDNSIIYQTSISKYDGDFKGFEVFNFGTITLDIPVNEISKIRFYPTR